MRSPPWVVPRPIPPGGEQWWAKNSPWLFETFPILGRAFRFFGFLTVEKTFFDIFLQTNRSKAQRKIFEGKLIEHLRKTVPEKYWNILTPDYSVACKRLVYDAFWFKSLHDPKVELTTRPLKAIEPRGVVVGSKGAYPPHESTESEETAGDYLAADAIIVANGFDVQTWLAPTKIVGREGAVLQEVWDERGGPQAYMGNAMDGFPNFFIIFGPNTATGHNSVILASENMVEYTLKFLKPILQGDVQTFEVKKEKEVAWANDMQTKLKDTVFMSGCSNWYQTDGWNATAYPFG